MGCAGCAVGTDGKAKGCKSNGGCASGGCNRLNTFDWLTQLDIEDSEPFDLVEVSFKNGSRKGFFKLKNAYQATTGDMVVVGTGNGFDIGRVSLSGELVRLQMKKKRINAKNVLHEVIRIAHERDLQRIDEARAKEVPTMIRSRVIARTLDLEMKIGDVEYQGDLRKATFYYTANGRVDFRELIRHYAKEFRVKIEMRQIGARQESARIGGLGSCGRELCCSTWLTDFKSVNTAAARYQNLAINQAKLSGQCGRLKCCLNYELDSYVEALKAFPKKADRLETQAGRAVLVKTDIFKYVMYYAYQEGQGRGKLYALQTEQVHEILEMNKQGEKPLDLSSLIVIDETGEPELDFADINDVIDLPMEKRSKKRRRNKNRNKRKKEQHSANKSGAKGKSEPPKAKQANDGSKKKQEAKKPIKSSNASKNQGPSEEAKPKESKSKNRRNRNNQRRNRNKGDQNKKKD